DHSEGRFKEVPDAGALAHELGIDRHADAQALDVGRSRAEDRHKELVGRTGEDRAAEDDRVRPRAGAECEADLLSDASKGAEILLAIAMARRPDADERHIGASDRFFRGHRGTEAMAGDDFG